MATSSTKISVEDSIQWALDAADTATGVTEEFNNIREQFEVQNIQAKRIYQSITIIFASSRLFSSSEPTMLNFGHLAPPKSGLCSILLVNKKCMASATSSA